MAMFGLNPMELMIVGFVVPAALVAIILLLQKKPPPNPNLLPCPDCGRLISREAKSCPQCGRPMSSPTDFRPPT